MSELPAAQNGQFPSPEDFDMGRAVDHAQNIVERPDYSVHPEAPLAPTFSSPDTHPYNPAEKATSDPDLPEVARHEIETRDAIIAHDAHLRDENEELYGKAYFDELTGLPNRRAWNERLTMLTGRNAQFGVIYLDLTNFKAINDHYGHGTGDATLKGFGQMAQEALDLRKLLGSKEIDEELVALASAVRERLHLREGDFLARLGGDEFGVVLDLTPRGDKEPVPPEEQAQAFIERLKDFVNTYSELTTFNKKGYGVAAGAAIFNPGESVDAVVARADAALYEDKRNMHAVVGAYRS